MTSTRCYPDNLHVVLLPWCWTSAASNGLQTFAGLTRSDQIAGLTSACACVGVAYIVIVMLVFESSAQVKRGKQVS